MFASRSAREASTTLLLLTQQTVRTPVHLRPLAEAAVWLRPSYGLPPLLRGCSLCRWSCHVHRGTSLCLRTWRGDPARARTVRSRRLGSQGGLQEVARMECDHWCWAVSWKVRHEAYFRCQLYEISSKSNTVTSTCKHFLKPHQKETSSAVSVVKKKA